jgi:hypothetical protein
MTFTSNAEVRAGGRRRGERGQTILLVAISIVTLLAMAALAIDVVSLYVARTEVQRAADAAALAGAKAIADSGVTTLQSGDPNLGAAVTLATDMATKAILAIVQATPLPVNLVAGGSPVQVAGFPLFNFNLNSNPTVTVKLQQANLPTFFARVFGTRSSIATATAMAEAYNPANLANFTPILTGCVKPWLMANSDPFNAGAPFVTLASGQVENPAPIGEQFYLSSACTGNTNDCFGLDNPPSSNRILPAGPRYVQFVPLQVTTNAGDVCPSSTASPCGGGNNPTYKQAEECCSVTPYTCGGTVSNANWDQTLNPEYQNTNSDLDQGAECLIHTSGSGLGNQDTLDWSTAPFPSGPPKITAGSGPQAGNNVSTSSSIVTVPIIDTSAAIPTLPPRNVTIVGFLQAFVNEADDLGVARHHGDISVTVMNVIGCSQTPNGSSPVIGGNGASPIPVRLISPQ